MDPRVLYTKRFKQATTQSLIRSPAPALEVITYRRLVAPDPLHILFMINSLGAQDFTISGLEERAEPQPRGKGASACRPLDAASGRPLWPGSLPNGASSSHTEAHFLSVSSFVPRRLCRHWCRGHPPPKYPRTVYDPPFVIIFFSQTSILQYRRFCQIHQLYLCH